MHPKYQKTFAALFLAVLLVVPVAAIAQSVLPEGLADIARLLVFWPRNGAEYVFMVCAFLGIYAHWFNRKRRADVQGTFGDYLLAEDALLSIGTFVVIYGVVMALLAINLIPATLSREQLAGVAIGGLLIGWVIDSILTKRNRKA